jgi:CheY-like chemotaxis protein
MTFDWKSKTILIAEDEPANYLFIEKVLKPTEVKIIRAENGIEALKLIQENDEIDLVLMDIYMPGMDGFEATFHIKEIRPDLPIIAQTFYQSQIEKEKVEHAHFDGFVNKPININKLLALLEMHLRTKSEKV